MPTILGVPVPIQTAATATSPELLLALANTLIWLLISLRLYIEIRENRSVGTCLAQQLENKRRMQEELVRKAREGWNLRKPRLEEVSEVDETEEPDEGFEVVPEWGVVLQNWGVVEEELREAMDDEISDRSEDGLSETPDGELREAMVDEYLDRREEIDIEDEGPEDSDSGDDNGLEMVRMPVRRLPDREESLFGRW